VIENGNRPPDIATALFHLRARLREAEIAPSRHRPHWTLDDMHAISALVDLPAAAEQIALARIEGMTFNTAYAPDTVERIRIIARKALGLPA
jgi:hypothetical protein